jgi:hypothetical protein
MFGVWFWYALGAGTIVHFEPFQRWTGAPPTPTSQISRADIAARAPAKGPPGQSPAGLGRYRHLVPFQLMKTGTECPSALPSPMAQAAVGEIAATAVRSMYVT